MSFVKRVALAAITAAAVVGFSTAPASASTAECDAAQKILCYLVVGGTGGDGGTCNGYVDSGCTYCSYQGAPTASSESWCDGDYSGYDYQNCTSWVAATCLVG